MNHNNPKIYLCAFGNLNLSTSAYRFYHQALSMGIFENIFIYNECNLDLDFVCEFRGRFYEAVDLAQIGGGGNLTSDSFAGGRDDPFFMGENLVRVTRGFGYWCWKPQIILQSLRQINDGDILIYADIGCEFVPSKAKSLLKKLEILKNNDIVGFIAESDFYKEIYWTKNDIFKYFGVENDPNFTESFQMSGGLIFMKKSAKTIQIITEWLDIFKNHWNLIDDSPSQTPNHKDFRENRHDQSIWSILNKKYGLKNFDDYYSNAKESYAIIDSRERSFTLTMYLTQFKYHKNIDIISNISIRGALKAWLKLGGKILPTSKARKNCRKLLGLREV